MAFPSFRPKFFTILAIRKCLNFKPIERFEIKNMQLVTFANVIFFHDKKWAGKKERGNERLC